MPLFRRSDTSGLPRPFNPRNARVLIVDDSSSDVLLASRALEKLGIKKYQDVSSAEKAMVELSRNHYQVALVDINLPGRNGIELLKAIRQQYPTTRVIMVTGARDEQVAVSAMKSGAADYISKDDYLTSGILNSISITLTGIESEQAELIQTGASLDTSIAEAEYMLNAARLSRDSASMPSLQSDAGFWTEARRLMYQYVSTYLVAFPERPHAEEDQLLAAVFDHGVSPRDVVMLYKQALEMIEKEAGGPDAAEGLWVSPGLVLAILLQRWVEECQLTLSLASLQSPNYSSGEDFRRTA